MMLKIALVGVMAILLSMLAGSVKREYGFLVSLCAALLIFSFGLGKLRVIVDELRNLVQEIPLDREYGEMLLKMVGIAYLTQLAVNLSRDAGQGAVAGQISFVGKLSMLFLSLPVLKTLIETIGEMLR